MGGRSVNQKVAVGILKKLGLTVEIAADGDEAVKALEKNRYDLVLMDCQMPVLDGYEATELIRDPSSRVLDHQVPIIAMTANAMEGDREKCLEVGMNDYLSKPVNPQALSGILEKWLPDESEAALHVFDRRALVKRLEEDEELVQTVIDRFLEEIPLQVKTLKGFLETGYSPGVVRQARTIRSASSAVEGNALREIASWIEQAGRDDDLSGAKAGMFKLEAQLEKLKTALCDAPLK